MTQYIILNKLDELFSFINEAQSKGFKYVIISGGTDLTLKWRKNSEYLHNYDYVLDISYIRELQNFIVNEEFIYIGAVVKIEELMEKQHILYDFPALIDALSVFATWHIRNMATIGGSIMSNRSLTIKVPLALYSALIDVINPHGKRQINLIDILSGKEKINQHEIISGIMIKKGKNINYNCSSYVELKNNLLPLIGSAALITDNNITLSIGTLLNDKLRIYYNKVMVRIFKDKDLNEICNVINYDEIVHILGISNKYLEDSLHRKICESINKALARCK